MGGEPLFLAGVARKIAEGRLDVDFGQENRPAVGLMLAMKDMVRELKSALAPTIRKDPIMA
ncbi:MAG: hypothetical protein H7839_13320 [Magnetococcus sp. YQC-5]